MSFRNGNRKSMSMEAFLRKKEFRVKHNLCLSCGKRPCNCKRPIFSEKD